MASSAQSLRTRQIQPRGAMVMRESILIAALMKYSPRQHTMGWADQGSCHPLPQ